MPKNISPLPNKVLSSEQEKLLQKLGQLQIGVLVWGAALALQIGHRKSYDLDFLTHSAVDNQTVTKIQQALGDYQLSQRLQSDTQYTAFADEIKITLFQDSAPLLHPTLDYLDTKIVAVPDIFATKLYILGRRATWRDYCDIAVCLDQGFANLDQGIAEAVQRYQVAERWILEPLTYFADVEMMPVEWTGKSYTTEQIKNILIQASSTYVNKLFYWKQVELEIIVLLNFNQTVIQFCVILPPLLWRTRAFVSDKSRQLIDNKQLATISHVEKRNINFVSPSVLLC